MASIPGFTTKAVFLPLILTTFKLTPRSPPWRTGNKNLLDAACSAIAGGESTRFTHRISRPAGPKLPLDLLEKRLFHTAGWTLYRPEMQQYYTLPLKSARDTACPDGLCNLKSAILNGLGYMKMLAVEERSEANTVPWKTNRKSENKKRLRLHWHTRTSYHLQSDLVNINIRIKLYKAECQYFSLHDRHRAYN